MKETTVIKVGGALLAEDKAVDALWSSISRLIETRSVVVVHGGGPRATEVARRLGHEPRIVHGRRVTSDLDLEIVKWTMRGELNVGLVARACAHGLKAVGISGADAAGLHVEKRPPWNVDGEFIDFGWVGDVQEVDPALIEHLLNGGFLPVIAPLGIDREGRLYNVNADTVSCTIASALRATEFLLVTKSGGVRRRASDVTSHMATCNRAEFQQGRTKGWIAGGMLVKLKVAFEALDAGVPQVYVVSPDGILDRRQGTQVIE